MKAESEVLSVIQEYWHLLASGVAFVFGYARLHYKAEQNARDNAATRKELRDMEERRDKQRTEDLQRIEAVMGEVRSDIKTLLGRH